ncbi:MAG: peptide deformylase, partial [Parcubacteria group bacterium]|nr:peptide deformylase [Parcubacteria group bacterium]
MEILTGEKNPLLRQKSKPVEHFTKEVRDLISQMKIIMEKSNGVGLAAPQIGIPLRVITCEIDDKFYAFINPEIIKTSGKNISMEEGCLSLPDTYGEVIRPEKIAFRALNADGKKIKIKAFGLLSRVIQHEIDHLDGILFIDKAKNIIKDTAQHRIN